MDKATARFVRRYHVEIGVRLVGERYTTEP
jgi:hypothetical protein